VTSPTDETAERSATGKPRFSKATWLGIAGAGVLVVVLVIVAVATLGGGSSNGQNAANETNVSPGARERNASSAPPESTSPRPSRSAPPSGGTTHKVAGSLCDSVDFAPVAALGAPASKAATGDQQNKSDYVAYTCSRTFAKDGLEIVAVVTAYVSGDSASAARRYADARDHAPTKKIDTITGVGVTAFGFTFGEGGQRYYQLWAYDGNTQLGVRLDITSADPPTVPQWRDAVTTVGRTTYAKLTA
jgi:hypothetical protein